MNTTTTAAPKRPLGFWIIGLFALVWNLIGVAMWYLQVNMSAEQLAAELREAGFSPTVIHRNLGSRAADLVEGRH